MRVGDSWRKLAPSDLVVLLLLATAGALLHTVTNGQYGFHHDELATLDDARSLAWGYVAYPPLTWARLRQRRLDLHGGHCDHVHPDIHMAHSPIHVNQVCPRQSRDSARPNATIVRSRLSTATRIGLTNTSVHADW